MRPQSQEPLNLTRTVSTVAVLIGLLALPVGAQCDLDFEDLAEGSQFGIGAIFVTGGVQVVVEEFFLGPGCTTPAGGGVAFVGTSGCGAGNELALENVNVKFEFGAVVTDLELVYGYFGGDINLEINGDCVVAADPFSLPAVVGGVAVTAVGDPCGTLTFIGDIAEFRIGGQEFFIDCLTLGPLAPVNCDLGFEDLPTGMNYPNGSIFTTDGIQISVEDFFFGPGCTSPTANGFAFVDSSGCGSGNELGLNNVNVKVILPGPVESLSLVYAYFGGNINLEINGDCAEAPDPLSLPPSLGGVVVTTTGATCGDLILTGVINSFKIGGQEFFIDCLNFGPLAPVNCDLGFEDLPTGMNYPNGSIFTTDGIQISVEDFFFGPGCTSPTANGFAFVDSSGCGSGNELGLNNVNVKVILPGPVESLSLVYAYFGGNINLEINGDCAEAPDPLSLPPSLGGVVVTTTGATCGDLILTGVINSFKIGGQEFFIDCIGMEPLSPNFVRGDASGDGTFNALVEAIFMLAFGFQNGPPPPCTEAADANGDGVLNPLVEAIFTLAFGFQGGPPPPAPYPNCGPDPDPANSLGCLEFPACAP